MKRLLLCLAMASAAQAQQPTTTLRLAGDTAMRATVEAWEAAFRAQHPEVRFETSLQGTDTAMPALYNHLADLALMGRLPDQTESDGFLHTLQYRPLQMELMSGSLDTPEASPAPVALVSRDNPVASLTLEQLRRALGCSLDRTAHPCARTWGDLGATGAWATHPLHVYTFDAASGTGLFLLERLQGPSRKMNWPAITEFHDRELPTGRLVPAAEQIAEALRHDPDGLALSLTRYIDPQLKPLALAADSSTPPVAATAATVASGQYPLARRTYCFADQPPGTPLAPALRAFLLFLMSAEGQAIAAQRGFLALPPAKAATQRALLQP